MVTTTRSRLVGAALLVGIAASASFALASEPRALSALQPDTAKSEWSRAETAADGRVHEARYRDHEGSREAMAKKPSLDRSGAKRFGKASFYANFFAGRKMADGNIMDPHTNNAASRTLPLGTTAKVTNLQTGKSAIVTIQDRGPYVDGRIVDLSPATARQIGITKREGIAKVEVAPIAVPMPDGRIKLGAAASDPQVALNLPSSTDAERSGW